MTMPAAPQDAVAGYSILKLAIALAAVLAGTKALGWVASRLGQSGSLGEIVAGVLLGGSVLGILDPRDPVIHALGQAGVLILLFSAGLHTNPAALVRPAAGSRPVAIAGVAVPFLLGAAAMFVLGGTWIEALTVGAALGATAVFVSARTLRELGLLEAEEGRVVQGAAVIDDTISLGIVAVVMALVTASSATAELILGSLLVPTAFIAGLLLDAKGLNGRVERITSRLYWLVAPFFFAVTGALLDLRTLIGARTMLFSGCLIVVGVVGKLAAGWAPRRFAGNRLLVGTAMIPRGAIGLIVAQLAVVAGAIENAIFASIVVMVFVTSIVTPPLLRAIATQQLKSRVPA